MKSLGVGGRGGVLGDLILLLDLSLTPCVALPRHFTFLGLNFLTCTKTGLD